LDASAESVQHTIETNQVQPGTASDVSANTDAAASGQVTAATAHHQQSAQQESETWQATTRIVIRPDSSCLRLQQNRDPWVEESKTKLQREGRLV